MIEARRAVMAMHAYLPPLEGRRSKVRLDFNENTVGFPDQHPDLEPSVLSAYPEYQELIEKLAEHLELPADHVLITNASDEGLFVAGFTFIEPNDDVAVISAPTFSLIPHYLQLCQARIREVPVHDDLSFDLEGLEQALGEGAKLAMLASPDNPTGGVIPVDRLEEWLQKFENTLFVIDEAYYEYWGQTVLPLVPRYPNLIVSRTFSKGWGMAGLRLGFLASQPQAIEWMRRVRSPYSVNSVAVKTALAFLPQVQRVKDQAADVMRRKQGLMEQVRSQGYRLTEGAANFFLIWAGPDAKPLARFLSERGTLVRDRSNLLKMGGSVRVSMGSSAEMKGFMTLLREFRRRHAIIFDLDDTLVDCTASFDHCIETLSGASREEILALKREGGFNDDWEAATELLRRAGRPRPLEEVKQEGMAMYLEVAPQVEKLMLEPDGLKALARRHPLFVYTGRYRVEYDSVWAERLSPLLSEVVCKDDFPHNPKPAPDGLLDIIHRHELLGGAYVGNSVDDMRAARAAGLTAIGVTFNQSEETLREAGAEYVLENVAELAKLYML